MDLMSGFLLVLIGFFFGFFAGGLVLVWQATQPNGYRSIGGHRCKLTRMLMISTDGRIRCEIH